MTTGNLGGDRFFYEEGGRGFDGMMRPYAADGTPPRFTLLPEPPSKETEERRDPEEVDVKTYDVQSIEIMAPVHRVFEFLRVPGNLPRWTHAFVSAGGGRARLETPAGAVDVALDVAADVGTGCVDWRLGFPDGGAALAQSRVTGTARGTCIFTFVLHAPPVALEQVEGALEAQTATLRSELAALKSLMEGTA